MLFYNTFSNFYSKQCVRNLLYDTIQKEQINYDFVIICRFDFLNEIVGFIGFEVNKNNMVYKIKDTSNARSTGFRCHQSGKEKIIKLLNKLKANDNTSKIK